MWELRVDLERPDDRDTTGRRCLGTYREINANSTKVQESLLSARGEQSTDSAS